jgi:hypothetical protein
MAVPAITVQWQRYLMFGLICFGVGLSLPISEKIFPDKYPPLPQNELAAELLTFSSLNQSDFISACLQKMADSNAISFIEGRAIYPRFYFAGEGERLTDSVGYKVVNEGRLVFNLVGQVNRRFIFKTPYPPDFFPHASDVILVSSKNGELWFAYVKQGDNEGFYISESFDPSACQ